MTDVIFWSVMALTFAWNMCDGGTQSIREWRAVRALRKKIKEYENEEYRNLSHL